MDYYLEHFDVHCKQVITNLPVLSFSIFLSCHSHVLLILECQQSRESQGPTLTSVNTSSWPRCHIRTLWKTFRTQSSPCLMNHEPHSQALHVLFKHWRSTWTHLRKGSVGPSTCFVLVKPLSSWVLGKAGGSGWPSWNTTTTWSWTGMAGKVLWM